MANVGAVGLDWQERINWDRLRKYRLERARERMKAHGSGRDAADVRRERALRHQHADSRLESPEAGPALCAAVRRRCSRAVRAGRHRHAHREAFAVDSQRQHPLFLRLDQGRRRAGLHAAGGEVHQCHPAGNEEERRRRHEAGCRFHRHQHDQDLSGLQDQMGRRHDAHDGGARRQESGRARMHAHRRRHRRRRALGIHEIPEARSDRESAHGAHHGVSLQHSRHGRRGGRDRIFGPQHVAQLAQLLRPHHQARRHGVHGSGRAHLERLQILLLPDLHGGPRAESGTEGLLRHSR